MEGTHRLVGIEMCHQPQNDHTLPAHQTLGMDSPANTRATEHHQAAAWQNAETEPDPEDLDGP